MPVKGLNFIPSEVQEKGKQEGFFREILINSYVIFGINGEFESRK